MTATWSPADKLSTPAGAAAPALFPEASSPTV